MYFPEFFDEVPLVRGHDPLARLLGVGFNARTAPMDAAQKTRFRAIQQGQADTAELDAFAGAWQDRVRRFLLEHADDPETVLVTELAAGGSAA